MTLSVPVRVLFHRYGAGGDIGVTMSGDPTDILKGQRDVFVFPR